MLLKSGGSGYNAQADPRLLFGLGAELDLGQLADAVDQVAHGAAELGVDGLLVDLPNVVPHTRRLLWSLGASRFKLTGARMHPEYDLRPAIPAELESRLERRGAERSRALSMRGD